MQRAPNRSTPPPATATASAAAPAEFLAAVKREMSQEGFFRVPPAAATTTTTTTTNTATTEDYEDDDSASRAGFFGGIVVPSRAPEGPASPRQQQAGMLLRGMGARVVHPVQRDEDDDGEEDESPRVAVGTPTGLSSRPTPKQQMAAAVVGLNPAGRFGVAVSAGGGGGGGVGGIQEAFDEGDDQDLQEDEEADLVATAALSGGAKRGGKMSSRPPRKGPWTSQEDQMLSALVEKYGPKDWSFIASHIDGRIGKQCRERYHNHLAPEVRKDAWTPEEDEAILRAHRIHGNKWTDISRLLGNGRPPNAIKNRWNSALKRRVEQAELPFSEGMDPRSPKSPRYANQPGVSAGQPSVSPREQQQRSPQQGLLRGLSQDLLPPPPGPASPASSMFRVDPWVQQVSQMYGQPTTPPLQSPNFLATSAPAAARRPQTSRSTEDFGAYGIAEMATAAQGRLMRSLSQKPDDGQQRQRQQQSQQQQQRVGDDESAAYPSGSDGWASESLLFAYHSKQPVGSSFQLQPPQLSVPVQSQRAPVVSSFLPGQTPTPPPQSLLPPMIKSENTPQTATSPGLSAGLTMPPFSPETTTLPPLNSPSGMSPATTPSTMPPSFSLAWDAGQGGMSSQPQVIPSAASSNQTAPVVLSPISELQFHARQQMEQQQMLQQLQWQRFRQQQVLLRTAQNQALQQRQQQTLQLQEQSQAQAELQQQDQQDQQQDFQDSQQQQTSPKESPGSTSPVTALFSSLALHASPQVSPRLSSLAPMTPQSPALGALGMPLTPQLAPAEGGQYQGSGEDQLLFDNPDAFPASFDSAGSAGGVSGTAAASATSQNGASGPNSGPPRSPPHPSTPSFHL